VRFHCANSLGGTAHARTLEETPPSGTIRKGNLPADDAFSDILFHRHNVQFSLRSASRTTLKLLLNEGRQRNAAATSNRHFNHSMKHKWSLWYLCELHL